ncbi:MAG TPA: hypothetical protein VJ608_12815 [Albitalea sp.]|nr:hypothetical protein [Albitalea sp.]
MSLWDPDEVDEADDALAASDAPLFMRQGGRWVCRSVTTRQVLPDFEGVAYDPEAGLYVRTTIDSGVRAFRELGSAHYAGALEEADVLSRQMSLDL